MEHFFSVALAFLEMTFVMVGTEILHSQRKSIGEAPLYVALGLLFLFAQFICALDLRVAFTEDLSFQLGGTVLFLPYLAMMLTVYAVDGTLAAHRLIIGSLVLFGLYYYLAEITRIECSWAGFSLSDSISGEGLDFVLEQSRRTMMAVSLAHLLDLFLLPIIFTRLKNAGCRMFFCVLGALWFTQIAESILYIVILSWRNEDFSGIFVGSLLARGVASFWISLLVSIYLRRIASESVPQRRSPLDIVFAFFGGYSRSKMLERRVQEWEGRYRQILRNASEIMVMLDAKGNVLDANPAAAVLLDEKMPHLLNGRKFLEHAQLPDGTSPESVLKDKTRGYPRYFELIFRNDDPEKQRRIACSLSLMNMYGGPVRVLIGRDVTEEARLAADQQKLREQLAHSQRIESLGQLAGGIAHDFNNHLHAILGNVDLIQMAYAPKNPDLARRLDKIAEIAESSGKLTSQLLGFARKGNYQIKRLDLRDVLRKSIDMLIPKSQADLELTLSLADIPCEVQGDAIQLQQLFVNLMLNALDAMQNIPGKHLLAVCLGEALSSPLPPQPPTGEGGSAVISRPPEDFYFVSISDSGCGMDHATLQRIFEPFFTTKPVGQGTGMGLAMVYGTVTSHHGWIQVDSTPGKGTVFCIFLPKAPLTLR